MTALLFQPTRIGGLTLPNRIAMPPLTRARAGQPGNVPTALNATYYAQRASAGLIVAEATDISPDAKGYALTPGIHSAAQLTAQTLADARSVAALLDRKVEPLQAAQYRAWALSVAEKVAMAASEGGVLGFGGARLSATERQLIDELRAALGA